MKGIITIIGILICLNGFSQTTNEMWTETDTISSEIYEFQVPTSWRNYGKMMNGKNGPEQFFEASGKGLPISFNGGPIKISIFLVKLDKAKNLKDAKESTINGYFENPDRIFENEDNYSEKPFELSDSSESILLNTRFYRTSKRLNQSRYDLITYSKEHKTAYMFTVSFQYIDKTYEFETDKNLIDYAEKLYKTFKWK
ncbi:hypothetical protein [Salegentibacter maritimus]|uniref:hypothetical protein n=1 Tax=Salegentibacter maritimus TaxID=2794347 RepID=UPI0018E48451|nr:hypothetical protein [Salegentibacter maritimus]MBI6118371.1 hypothetical protein [Salegentibacter maritimus]